MNQLGPIFKEARERSGKTLDDAVRETKIAKKYLVAIENENFDMFPGETYCVGFIRNYAQFLGLDPNEMIQKYRNYKIQEQPAPIEQLTARPRNIRHWVLLSLVGIVVISASIYFILSRKAEKVVSTVKVKNQVEISKTERVAKAEHPKILFEEEELIKNFKKGDEIVFPLKGKDYSIFIENPGKELEFSVAHIPFSISKDELVDIDFDRDGKKDLSLKINNLQSGVVNLTLKRIFGTNVNEPQLSSSQPLSIKPGITGGTSPEVMIYKVSELEDKTPLTPDNGFIIVSSYDKTSIEVNLTSHNTAYFAYIIDSGKKTEKLLKKGDELNLEAQKVLKLMVADTSGIKCMINNIPVDLSKDDEIIAKMVKWYKDKETKGLYNLVMTNIQQKHGGT